MQKITFIKKKTFFYRKIIEYFLKKKKEKKSGDIWGGKRDADCDKTKKGKPEMDLIFSEEGEMMKIGPVIKPNKSQPLNHISHTN